MLKNGILNPAMNALLSRVRHTNTLVIADRGFPYWPRIETIDISLVDDIPRVVDVLRAVLANFHAGKAYMAEEFTAQNAASTVREFEAVLVGVPVLRETHLDLKRRVPEAIGLIRTGDTTQYANVVLESS